MWAEWSTAQIALIISGLSFCLALASFVWNIWSKFIFPRPKLRVWADLRYAQKFGAHSASLRENGTFAGDLDPSSMAYPAVALCITNYGPGAVTVTSASVRLPRSHPRRREGHGLLVAYNNYPEDLSASSISSGGLPKKLDVGEAFELYFPVNPKFMATKEVTALGVRDTLSRLSWVSRQNMRRLRKQFEAHQKLQP